LQKIIKIQLKVSTVFVYFFEPSCCKKIKVVVVLVVAWLLWLDGKKFGLMENHPLTVTHSPHLDGSPKTRKLNLMVLMLLLKLLLLLLLLLTVFLLVVFPESQNT